MADSVAESLSLQDREESANLFRGLTWAVIVVATAAPLALFILIPAHWQRWLTIVVATDSVALILLVLNKRGFTKTASVFLISLLVVPPILSSIAGGGIRGPAMYIFPVAIVVAGILLGDLGAVVTAFVCAAAGLGLVIAEVRGVLPPNTSGHTPVTYWVLYTLWNFALLNIQRLANHIIQGASRSARTELAERVIAEKQLKTTTEELEKALRAAAASEAEFRAIFDHAPFGLALSNREGAILLFNSAFERFLGYEPGELKNISRHDVTYADDWAASTKVSEALRRGDINSYEIEKRYIRKDGQIVWGRLTATRFVDSANTDRYGLAVLEDITARKKAEEDRKKLEAQYLQAQKMEAIGQLAGGVAHDFNNLLTVIDGYSNLMLQKLPEHDGSHSMMLQIKRASGRASALTRQLLAFSRKTVLEPVELDVNDLIANLEKMLHRLIGEHISLSTSFSPQAGRIKADPALLEQAIVNLAVNARDAMPGGGRITIETQRVELDSTYISDHPDVPAGVYTMIAVSDTGHGIDPTMHQAIFEPFFTTKSATHGTGLGLSMVYGFVKQSGGHVSLYSELGRGATFKLYLPAISLPARSPVAQPAESQAKPVEMKLGRETILLVEDEDGVRNLSKLVLSECGYEVLAASNGEAALELAKSPGLRIHLLLSDVVMPEMTGPALADKLRGVHPEAKVLFISGYTDDAVVRHGVLQASTQFLQKPFSPTRLAEKVREVLDG